MSDSRQLVDVRNDAAARADMVVGATTFVTITQANTWINQAITELRDLMIAEYGDDWISTVGSPKTATPSVDKYALDADVYKLIGVDVSFDGGTTWRTCERFEMSDRNRTNRQYGWSASRVPRYRLFGSQLFFMPPPDSALTYRTWHIPAFTRLVNDSDPFDFVHGWDDWVACRVAIRMLQKEESDSSALERDLGIIAQRIGAAVRFRDSGAPKRVQDTARRSTRSWSDDLDEEGF